MIPKKKSGGKGDDAVSVSTTTISSSDKTAMRSIIAALNKNPQAKPFMYPVDSATFPEYYEMIKKPMDITTLREKVNSGEYAAIEHALVDLRQIWENCRLFNSEGSDIYATADALDAETAQLVEEKMGKEYVKAYRSKGKKPVKAIDTGVGKEEKKPKKEAAAASSSSSSSSFSSSSSSSSSTKPAKKGDAVALTKKCLMRILKDLKASDCALPFLHPVDLAQAPGYLEYVTEPMDLSTVEKNLKGGSYEGVEGTALFATHMRLIWSNCNAYNDPKSEIATWSSKLGVAFEGLYKEAWGEAVAERKAEGKEAKGKVVHIKEEKKKDEGSAEKEKKEDSPVLKKMKRVVKELMKDLRSGPFMYPINVDEAPGYSDIIDQPMALTTVKQLLETGTLTPSTFFADMCLIFDNCRAYNTEESELFVWATELKVVFNELYKSHVEAEMIIEAKREDRKERKLKEALDAALVLEKKNREV